MAVRTVAEQPTYTFAAGLVTEQSAVSVVPGSALDMENYEIDVAGALRRRKAIALEDGGGEVSFGLSAIPSNAAVRHRLWHNAGGTPGRTVHVIQVGSNVRLVQEDDTLSTYGSTINTVDLLSYKTSSATTAQVYGSQVSFVDARSHLIVTGPYVEPFYISLSGNTVTTVPIELYIRDFAGIEDGVEVTTQPDTEVASHIYNLYNRGWSDDEIDDYVADTGTWPAKNMVPWLGYLRQVDAGVQEGYGTKVWSSTKLAAEAFRNVSAPQGSLLLNPFDTTVGLGGSSSGTVTNNIDISSWSRSGQEITVTLASAHGVATGDSVQIVGNQYTWYRLGFAGTRLSTTGSLDGVHTVTVTGINSFRFTTTNNFQYFVDWGDGYGNGGQYDAYGVAVVENSVTTGGVASTVGYITEKRPTAVAWFAGRVFYAGCEYSKLADTVFFSQIVEDVGQYGKCYQRNDPTAENFNALLATDGGTIKIPGLFGVMRMEILGSSLLLFTRAGVWEIRGGQGGFTATDFSVRKVTDAEVTSPAGVCRTDTGIIFATKRGLYAAGVDPNSGFISAGSLSESRVNTYWNSIPATGLSSLVVVYDDAKKRVYTLISKPTEHVGSPLANSYTEALVLDFRIGQAGAFYKINLPYGAAGTVIGALALDNADNPQSNKKVKFIWKPLVSTSVTFLDMEHTGYEDEDGGDYIPFFRAAVDPPEPQVDDSGRVQGNWHKRKQAGLYVYMFMGRTETGWTEVDGEYYPVNPSSVIIQGRWEWSDSSNSGKWTNPQQAYRQKNLYTPWDGPDEGMQDGFPVIVTRNKIRGSGRSLALYIRGEQGKDSHVLGWLIQYGVT